MNKIIAIGNVGSEPEVKFLDNGTAVCNISIACNERWKDKDGNKQERTEWLRLVFWRQLAEVVGQYCHKGDKIYIEGKIRTRSYDKDGTQTFVTEVEVRELELLTPKGSNGNGNGELVGAGSSAPPEDLPF